MWAKYKQTAGFTIVELLIVIVVISILAAITIIAYNGVQTRADNSKTVTAVEKYATALTLYSTDNASYPAIGYACLGNTANICSSTTGALACFGAGSVAISSTFDAAIKTVVNTLPQVSSQTINCGGGSYMGAYCNSVNGKSASINFFLRGNQTCPTVSVLKNTSRGQQDDVTFCTNTLPTLP